MFYIWTVALNLTHIDGFSVADRLVASLACNASTINLSHVFRNSFEILYQAVWSTRKYLSLWL